MRVLLFLAFLAVVAAFVPSRSPSKCDRKVPVTLHFINSVSVGLGSLAKFKPLENSKVKEALEPPKYPTSAVLGIGQNIPSLVFGPLSLIALIVGTYSFHQANILTPVTVNTINPLYVGGTFLIPISWGLHVAAWIQKQNGK